MKKKVGIMSMQRIINYGSFLQAFALSNTIRSLGHEVEFVDFKIEPCIDKPKEWNTRVSEKIYENDLLNIQNFEKTFKSKFLPELGVSARNERAKIDTLVIGSDEVFNCLQGNPQCGYSLELFGKDNNAQKIISYAASCGATTIERLANYNKQDEISNLLNKFNNISIRDENTRNFVKSLSNIEPIRHLDPVLIYDFSNDIKPITTNLSNYIIIYAYPFNFSENECELIKKFAKKHNKKIVSLGNIQKCTEIFIPAHPLEVLSYFQKADYIITNTFHGTIFSIKTHTPFVSFVRNYNSQKILDLLNIMNLNNRLISSLENIDNTMSQNIDFFNCDKIIESEKLRSINYLKNNI